MSDSQPHLDANGFVILPEETLNWHDPQAIVECQLCDDDGYRGHMVCDHREHSTPEVRAAAKAALAQALGKGGAA